ncbi:bifunctional 2-dehydro-3-deoxygluconokinase/2-dehydro-3-deoxygalactonokinase [Haloarcula sp. 1CSR25-25]|uniref:bifunctional 2-dehydro-3-deoxygluconokinase/2-dehydro-3- deoxygalactonokinase n=1 Tax=Haloarcula sp. 1CSR25-25 TaxID=2862545 RepID=UPI0028960BC9|nr:bifunctional 2-dehydro-3-deoxygluconokinase/2-dehydro-3-deoxygalactonokinase [Haloarcula sp. 1CSR25-25]MDT3435079.1 sugar kinase [Haloarcula sp. 1CSR25-25]
MTELVTFGETMLRLSPPDDERLETANQYTVRAAGAESNVAVAAQRLGLDAVWASKLPDSPVGRRVTGELQHHGVSTAIAWDGSDSARQGTYYLEQGSPPRGNEVIYDRGNASITTATPSELPTDTIADATGFHTSGITPALSETLESTTADLLSLAQDAGTTTSFDLNYRSKLWTPAKARSVLTELFPVVDVLVVAERDANVVLDRTGDPETIARDLAAEYGFETTVITRGSDGALAVADGTVTEQPTFASTDAHPVGTGDSFVGGFLSRYLSGGTVSDGLAWGAATAALKRTIPGDIAVVSPDEVSSILSGDTEAISR